MAMHKQDIFLKFGLNKKESKAIGQLFKKRHYAPYETILSQGELSDNFYYVGSGELIVLYEDAMGKENVQNVLGPGQFVGEIGLLQNMPRSATVKALTDVQLYRLFKSDFEDLLQHNQSFATLLDQTRIERQLALIPTFRNLVQKDLAKIREITHEVEVKSGEVICTQGDSADKLYLITQGSCSLTQIEKGEKLSTGHRSNGNFYDHEAFFKRRRYEHSLTAESDTNLLVLDMAELKALVMQEASLAANLPKESCLLKELSLWQMVMPFLYDKSAYKVIPQLSMNRPKLILYSMLSICFVLLFTATLPSIWPDHFAFLNHLKIDTDPENMLPADEPARVFHQQSRQAMDLYDMMVVGVVNTDHADGIYNVESLNHVYRLTEFAKTLQWYDAKSKTTVGVIASEMLAPSTVDNIEQAGPGAISFSWLMRSPPESREQAMALKHRIKKLPVLNGLLAAEDDQAIAIYLPLTSKDISFRVYHSLLEFVEQYADSDDQFYIAGLPVAEDAFGVEMFIQMAISAPLAMLAIFFMMYLFFRNITLITAPMIIAMVAVICTMALLVISGQTIHIMSSMIAIFVMPIAVLDSVHILSEFFDFHTRIKDRRLTMLHVMDELFVPMFYTSVTTALGFASLALVPIPPVQVFGLFVAIGVLLAWLLSISFIPAYIMLVPYKKIDAIIADREKQKGHSKPVLTTILNRVRTLSLKYARYIVTVFVLISSLFMYGISQIEVNDNPVRWFQSEHYLSVSDREMNRHFAGTYIAYLSLQVDDSNALQNLTASWQQTLNELQQHDPVNSALLNALTIRAEHSGISQWFDTIESQIEQLLEVGANEKDELFLEQALDHLDKMREQQQTFKQPEILNYIDSLQIALQATGVVGKSISLSDLVKLVNRELHEGDEKDFRIPDTASGVAQTLLTFQSSHRPQDIWHYTTHDYRRAVISLLLNSGDNIDMNRVVATAEKFMLDNPPPQALRLDWFGLNYINVVWQEKMVSGMMLSIIGSYLAVLFIMTLLLRSYIWGLLAMLPLSMTLLAIYGILGLSGKYYDMPVAVLSALAIGLAVDFAVHFLIRIRHYYNQCNDWQKSLQLFYGEPAQAFVRNILVITLGFTPLLLASLVPYNTVGILIAAIMLVTGTVSLVLFTAFFAVASGYLFKRQDIRRTNLLDCRSIVFSGCIAFILFCVGLQGFIPFSPGLLWVYIIVAVIVVVISMKKCAGIKIRKFNRQETH